MSDEEAQEHFDNFFEDVFVECEDKVYYSPMVYHTIAIFHIFSSMVKLRR